MAKTENEIIAALRAECKALSDQCQYVREQRNAAQAEVAALFQQVKNQQATIRYQADMLESFNASAKSDEGIALDAAPHPKPSIECYRPTFRMRWLEVDENRTTQQSGIVLTTKTRRLQQEMQHEETGLCHWAEVPTVNEVDEQFKAQTQADRSVMKDNTLLEPTTEYVCPACGRTYDQHDMLKIANELIRFTWEPCYERTDAEYAETRAKAHAWMMRYDRVAPVPR